ncbi:MAG: AMP-binding protein [Candidatus Rokubacteria bacterium]|nr:AMP-binding protein [Candidatus Rokubacteria bacterium]
MIPQGCTTLVEALLAAPAARRFVTMWSPERSPEEETLTWGEFLALAQRYRARLEAGGLGPGDRVILVLPQGIPLLASFVGALLGGQVPAILAYPTFKADPAKYRDGLAGVSRNLQARAVVLDREFPAHLSGLIGELAPVVFADREPSACEEPARTHAAGPGDIAFIQHSAGTTGLQKGVSLSHRSVLAQLRHLSDALGVGRDDCIVSWLPLYHDMGLIACLVLSLACHLRLVLLSPTDWVVQPSSLLELATRHRATLCWLPNFAFQFLARRVPEEYKTGLDLRSLRAVVNCSEPVLQRSLDEFVAAYEPSGFRREALATCYAMAENTFAVTHSRPGAPAGPPAVTVDGEALRREGVVTRVPADPPAALTLVSSGECLPGNLIRIVRDDGEELAPGRVGEILIRSDSLFQGYFNRPDLTGRALREGWYHSGDLGFVLDRNLYVLGRKDDVIIVGGENFHPQDIEEVACGHPDVHDGRAVAFGVRNPSLGTHDIVVVVEAEHADRLVRKREIELEVRRRLTNHLGVAPRVVWVVPPRWMVKSTAGKPARSTNRRKFLQEHPELDTEGSLGR